MEDEKDINQDEVSEDTVQQPDQDQGSDDIKQLMNRMISEVNEMHLKLALLSHVVQPKEGAEGLLDLITNGIKEGDDEVKNGINEDFNKLESKDIPGLVQVITARMVKKPKPKIENEETVDDDKGIDNITSIQKYAKRLAKTSKGE